MRIVALDIATVTGVAIGEPGGRPDTQTWRLKTPKQDYDVVGGEMGRKIRDLCFLADTRPDLIVCEAPIPPYQNQGSGHRENPIRRSIESILIPQRALGAIQAIAACYGIEVLTGNMQTVRKHFTGRARYGSREETKSAVIQRCVSLGFVPAGFKDDNICDALALFSWASALRAPRAAQPFTLFGQTA